MSSFTFAVDTVSAGSITITADETTPTASGDDVTVNSGVTVESTGGDVIFDAGDNVVLQSGSVVKSDIGSVSFSAGVNDNDTIDDIVLNGTVIAAGGLTLNSAGI